MINLMKASLLSASIFSSFGITKESKVSKALNLEVVDKQDMEYIPRYNFSRKLPLPRETSSVDHPKHDFGYVESFYINIDDFVGDVYYTNINFVKSIIGPFHYEMYMTTAEGATYTLFKEMKNGGLASEFVKGVASIDFRLVDTWATFKIMCFDGNNPSVKNELEFILSSPQEIIYNTQEIRIAWSASLNYGRLINEEIRLELYNLSSEIIEKYYLRVPCDNIFMRAINRKSISYDHCTTYIKDNYGYFNKTYSLTSPKYPGYVGNRMGQNHLTFRNDLYILGFVYSQYVDQRTHMMSSNSQDFEFSGIATQYFMPKGKYELYKEIDCIFEMTNLYYTGIDLVFPFKVKYLAEHPDMRIRDNKGSTLSDEVYKNFMREELV